MHSTCKESKAFISLLYQIQDEFDEGSKEMAALNRLINYSKSFVAEFTACEYFTINKTVVFSFLANVATYVVIAFQVDQSHYQQMLATNG